MMNGRKKRGFTVVELVTVLVILGILIGLAIPGVLLWRKHAEFRKDESYAKTLFLSAQSGLASYEAAETLNELMAEIDSEGLEITPEMLESGGAEATLDADSRIRSVILEAGKQYNPDAASAEDRLRYKVRALLELYTYDPAILNSAIVVEFDTNTQTVFSVFCSTWHKQLQYESTPEASSIDDRASTTRSKRIIGYYSVKDAGNVVRYKPTRLKISNLRLENNEQLQLVWNMNVATDVADYTLTFYKKGADGTPDTEWFHTTLSDVKTTDSWKKLELYNKDNTPLGTGTYGFPISVTNNTFTLTLDSMMRAQDVEDYGFYYGDNKADGVLDGNDYLNGLSITRLGVGAEDIYVQAQAIPKASAGQSYLTSDLATCRAENALYADAKAPAAAGADWEVSVKYFRHLYNIRWLESQKENGGQRIYTQVAADNTMNWNTGDTAVFASVRVGADTAWARMPSGAAFPTVPELGKDAVYNGGGQRISGLILNRTSVPQTFAAGREPDASKTGLAADPRYYLGLFGVARGTVYGLDMSHATLTYKRGAAGEEKPEARTLYGAGLICGLSTGRISDVSVLGANTAAANMRTTVDAVVSYDPSYYGGVGGIAGALVTDGNAVATLGLRGIAGELPARSEILMQGTVTGVIETGASPKTLTPALTQGTAPAPGAQTLSACESASPRSGVGGIVGFMYNANLGRLAPGGTTADPSCTLRNEADVTGNLLVGGIVGSAETNRGLGAGTSMVVGAQNTGLVKCSAKTTKLAEGAPATNAVEGYYIGGVVGYANEANLKNLTSTAGSTSAGYSAAQKDSLLLGKYVGGIVGFGYNVSIDATCSTGTGGYILGDQEVGGIAGGVSSNKPEGTLQITTTNASYVIGNKNVGGIVGSNSGKAVLQGCTNSGVVAATQRNAGGVAGSNTGIITDCTSTVYTYGDSLYNKLKAWQAYGDNAGGIVGYNNGRLMNNTTLPLAPMVVGGKCVGGVVGFNGPDAEIRFAEGQVYRFTEGRVVGMAAAGDANLPSGGATDADALLGTGAAGQNIYLPLGIKGDYVGGVVGYNQAANLFDNTFEVTLAEVSGHDCVGGVIGSSVTTGADLTLDICNTKEASLGTVTGNRYVGGLIGRLENPNGTALMENDEQKTRNYMNVFGWQYTGGVIGYAAEGTPLTIENVINAGMVSQPAGEAPLPIPVGELLPAGTYNEDDLDALEGRATGKNGERLFDAAYTHCVGGIIGYNNADGRMIHCENSGTVVSGEGGVGGIAGVNVGDVFNCVLNRSIGSGTTSAVGGLVGINAGIVRGGRFAEDISITANSCAGGLVAMNLYKSTVELSAYVPDGETADDTFNLSVRAQINALQNAVGGLVGWNNGQVLTAATATEPAVGGSISGQNYVGGVIGFAADNSSLVMNGSADSTDAAITLDGNDYVGGIFGRFAGSTNASSSHPMVNRAAVTARQDFAGGIAGVADGDLIYAENYGEVTALDGDAAGITAINDHNISNCKNTGNVSAQNGAAGGIVAVNNGTLTDCEQTNDDHDVTLLSGADLLGGIAGENFGTIAGCNVTTRGSYAITLSGNAASRGGIVGYNHALHDGAGDLVRNLTGSGVSGKVSVITEGVNARYVGGLAGQNDGWIDGESGGANSLVSIDMTYDNVVCLGGVVGENRGLLANCNYSGTLKDTGTGGAGYSVGGIAGRNGGVAGGENANLSGGTLENCNVSDLTITMAKGECPDVTSALHDVKDKNSSHMGGITGRNGAGSSIRKCTLSGTNKLTVSTGGAMLGGVTGYNQGEVENSGNKLALNNYIEGELADLDKGSDPNNYSQYGLDDGETTLTLTGGSTTAAVGGIVGLNGPAGLVEYCATGTGWSVLNGSANADSTAGGIIGMNEAEQTLTNLMNFAQVRRTAGSNSQVAGGIIGRQENRTTKDFTITNCLNFGTIFSQSDRTGGIIGAWKYNGGTLMDSINYGNVSDRSMSSGIVSVLMYLNDDQTVNIVRCRNSSDKRAYSGILDRVYHQAGHLPTATINIVDCINTGNVRIGGIYGAEQTNTNNKTTMNIIRCRNYGDAETNGNGIAGKASGLVTNMSDCFDASLSDNALSDNAIADDNGNYFVDAYSFAKELTGEAEPTGTPGPTPTPTATPAPTTYIAGRVYWDDQNNATGSRPTGVTLQLRNNGTVEDEVTLNASTGWAHLWTGLNGDGVWTVTQKETPADYTVTVVQEADSHQFTVTDTYTGAAVPPAIQTSGTFARLVGQTATFPYNTTTNNVPGFDGAATKMPHLFDSAAAGRMSFKTHANDFVPVEFVIPFTSSVNTLDKVTTQWYGDTDRTYTYNWEVQYQGETTWTAGPSYTTLKSEAKKTAAAVVTRTDDLSALNVTGKKIQALKLKVTDEVRNGSSNAWVSLWNMGIYANGATAPMVVGSSTPTPTPTFPPTPTPAPTATPTATPAGTPVPGDEPSRHGTRLYLTTFGTTGITQYFSQILPGNTSATLMNQPLTIKDKKDVLLEDVPVASVVLKAADASLDGTFSNTSTVKSPANWELWEMMLAKWYDSLFSINAPTDLEVKKSGQNYEIGWTDTNDGRALYYYTQLFLFDSEADAAAALAEGVADPTPESTALSALTPETNRYTYSGSTLQLTLQPGWAGRYFVVRTRAAGPNGTQSDWDYTQEPQRFVAALVDSEIRGELKLTPGATAIAANYKYYYRVTNGQTLSDQISQAIEQETQAGGALDGLTLTDLSRDGKLYWGVDILQNNGTEVNHTAGRLYASENPVYMADNGGNVQLSQQNTLNTWEQVKQQIASWGGDTADETAARQVYDAYVSQAFGNSAQYTTMSKPQPSTNLSKEYPISAVGAPVLSGDKLDGLTVTSTITSGSSTPAGYVVELVCVQAEHEENGDTVAQKTYVLQQNEIVLQNGQLNVTFTNIDEAVLSDANNTLYVRVRLAQSPLGPLYYYNPASGEDANIIVLKNGEESYSYSPLIGEDLLGANSQWNKLLMVSSALAYQAIPAPKNLTAQANLENESFTYTFTWDAPDWTGFEGYAPKNWVEQYEAKVIGHNTGSDGSDVANVLNDSIVGSTRKLVLAADSWSYERIELQAIPVGGTYNRTSDNKSVRYLGETGKKTWDAMRRLLAPGQPQPSLTNYNDMLYSISWLHSRSDVLPEGGGTNPCARYEVRISGTDADDNILYWDATGTQVPAGTSGALTYTCLGTVSADGSTTYTLADVDMSGYAGAKLNLYVVAIPADASYYDSPSSVQSSWTIATRLDSPEVENLTDWQPQWHTEPEDATLRAEFLTETLLQKVVISNFDSTLTYVSRAYIYTDDQMVKDGDGNVILDSDGQPTLLSTVTEPRQVIAPAAMGGSSTGCAVTYRNVEPAYARGWVLPSVRATRGGAVSSLWTEGVFERLPYIRLDTPELSLGSENRTYSGQYNRDDTWTDFTEDTPHPFRTVQWTQAEDSLARNYTAEVDWLNDQQRIVELPDGTATPESAATAVQIKVTGETTTETVSGVETEVTTYTVQKKLADQPDLPENWVTLTREPGEAENIGLYTFDTLRLTGNSSKVTDLPGSRDYRIDMPAKLAITQADDGTTQFVILLPDPDGRLYEDEDLAQTVTGSVYVTAQPGVDQPAYVASETAEEILNEQVEGYLLEPTTPESARTYVWLSTGESARWAVLGMPPATPAPKREDDS